MFWILAGVTMLRYWICLQAPISPAEAYVYLCARRLDVAFFDGPAGVATLVYWGKKFFANDLLALRWSAPLFAILATVAAYLLGKKLYGAGLGSTLLINVLPSFQLGSIRSENTLPILTFWLLSTLFIWNALKTRWWWWWLAGGITLAVGLQFSYWMLLVPLSCTLAITKRPHLGSVFGWGTLVLLCVAALVGPIEWNTRQQWIPFIRWTWQTFFEFGNGRAALLKLLEQISLPGAILGLSSLIFCLRNARFNVKTRFLTTFAVPPLIATLLLLVWNEVGPILPALALVFVWLGGWWQTTTDRLAWSIALACGLTAFCSMQALTVWPSFSDKGKAAIAIKETARIQSTIFPSHSGEIFFIADPPSLVAEFEYTFEQLYSTSETRHEIFLRESPDLSNQFQLWPSYCDFIDAKTPSNALFTEQKGINRYVGRSALYITPNEGTLPQTISAAFQRILPLYTLQISRNGQIFRRLHVYFCHNYQTLPL